MADAAQVGGRAEALPQPALPGNFKFLQDALDKAKSDLLAEGVGAADAARTQALTKTVEECQAGVDQVLAMQAEKVAAEASRLVLQRERDEAKEQLAKQTPHTPVFTAAQTPQTVLHYPTGSPFMTPYGGGMSFGQAATGGRNLAGVFDEQEVVRQTGQVRFNQALAASQSGGVQLLSWPAGSSAFQSTVAQSPGMTVRPSVTAEPQYKSRQAPGQPGQPAQGQPQQPAHQPVPPQVVPPLGPPQAPASGIPPGGGGGGAPPPPGGGDGGALAALLQQGAAAGGGDGGGPGVLARLLGLEHLFRQPAAVSRHRDPTKAPKLAAATPSAFASWRNSWIAWAEESGVARVVLQPAFSDVYPVAMIDVTGHEQGAFDMVERDIVLTEEAKQTIKDSKFAYLALMGAVAHVPPVSALLLPIARGNANAAYAKLCSHFQPKSATSRDMVEQEYADVRQREGESTDSYIARFQLIVSNLYAQGVYSPDEQQRTRFIRGARIPPGHVRDMLSLQPTLDQAAIQLRLWEQEFNSKRGRSNTREFTGAAAFAADADSGKRGGRGQRGAGKKGLCFICGQAGHWKGECPEADQSESQPRRGGRGGGRGGSRGGGGKRGGRTGPSARGKTIKCNWCAKVGHREAECKSKLAGEPRRKNTHPSAGSADAAAFSASAEKYRLGEDCEEHEVILDSGATHHMVRNDMPLVDTCTEPYTQITTASGRLTGPMSGNLMVYVPALKRIVDLGRAMRHDGISQNLLSVSCLLQSVHEASTVSFTCENALLKTFDGTVILNATGDGKLYRAKLVTIGFEDLAESGDACKSYAAFVGTVDATDLWHARLGHAARSTMQRMLAAEVVVGLDDIAPTKLTTCESCLGGKMHSLPFAKEVRSEHLANRSLQRVHADLHGPIQTPSLGGALYVLVIVDEFSSFVWSYPLTAKSDAASAVIDWSRQQKTALGRWPEEFHTDRGTEFLSGKLRNYWKTTGTKCTQTLAYTPQQNGKAERMNRTLVEMARTMMLAARAPKLLWGEAIQSAVCIYNMTHVGRSQRTPQEALMHESGDNQKPDVSFLRVWGCDAWRRVIKQTSQHKYDPVGVKMIFVGYVFAGIKFNGYRLLDPGNGRVEEARDIVFNEREFGAMDAYRSSLDSSEEPDDRDDYEFFEDIADRNELRMALEISRQLDQEAARRERVHEAAGERFQVPAAEFEPLSPQPVTPEPIPSDEEVELPRPRSRKKVYAPVERSLRERGDVSYRGSGEHLGGGAGRALPSRQSQRRRMPAERKLGMVNYEEEIGSFRAELAQLEQDLEEIAFSEESETQAHAAESDELPIAKHVRARIATERAAALRKRAGAGVPKLTGVLYESTQERRRQEEHEASSTESEADEPVAPLIDAPVLGQRPEPAGLGRRAARKAGPRALPEEEPIGARARRKAVRKARFVPVTDPETVEHMRQLAIESATKSRPVDPDRQECNKRGEIVAPTRRCTADNARGTQCGAKTRYGHLCWTHLKKQFKVRIKKSAISGMGLHADQEIAAGEEIGPYVGDIYRGEEAHGNFGGSRYGFELGKNYVIDAARTDTAVTRMVNDPKGSGRRANVRWVINPHRKTVKMVAVRRIKPGAELLIDYGADFWLGQEGKSVTPAPVRHAPPVERRAVSAEYREAVGPIRPAETESEDEGDFEERKESDVRGRRRVASPPARRARTPKKTRFVSHSPSPPPPPRRSAMKKAAAVTQPFRPRSAGWVKRLIAASAEPPVMSSEATAALEHAKRRAARVDELAESLRGVAPKVDDRTPKRMARMKLPGQAQAHSAAAIRIHDVPRNIAEAKRSPDWKEWEKAMAAEQASLRSFKVYHVVETSSVPPDKKPLKTKWVFAVKTDASGKVVRHKARLVVMGNTQSPLDYDQVYAPVAFYKSVRAVLAVAAQEDEEVTGSDVTCAYLHAPLEHEVYIRAPEGFIGAEAGCILKLDKSLYGLKQAGRNWNHDLVGTLVGLGYRPCENSDACVMVKISRTGKEMKWVIFVDDFIQSFARADRAEMDEDKKKVGEKYELKDLGDCTLMLGMRITRDRVKGTLKLDQQAYVESILKQFGFAECRAEITPASTGKLSTASTHTRTGPNEQYGKVSIENYSSVVGALMYAAGATRPDISFAVNMLSRDLAAPTAESVAAAKRVMRYLYGTKTLGLTYQRDASLEQAKLEVYSDADWAGDKETRRSTTGVIAKIANAAVVWVSRKQPNVAVSSTEAEYIAASEASRENYWLRVLLAAIGSAQPDPTPLLIDNQTSIRLALEESTTDRRKHIDVKHHYIREQASNELVELQWVPTAEQQADILTKPLPRATFLKLRALVMNETQ